MFVEEVLFEVLGPLSGTGTSAGCWCFFGDDDDDCADGAFIGSDDFGCTPAVDVDETAEPVAFEAAFCFSTLASDDPPFLGPSAGVFFFSPSVGQSPLFAVKSAAWGK